MANKKRMQHQDGEPFAYAYIKNGETIELEYAGRGIDISEMLTHLIVDSIKGYGANFENTMTFLYDNVKKQMEREAQEADGDTENNKSE